jgi:hypothetical protein
MISNPQILKSSILNPQILNPQSSILNPQSSILNPQILNPQSSILNPDAFCEGLRAGAASWYYSPFDFEAAGMTVSAVCTCYRNFTAAPEVPGAESTRIDADGSPELSSRSC